jgi:quinol monooxygenase YgiN
MSKPDRAVSIHPYFAVKEGKLPEFTEVCERLLAVASAEPGCLYYGFSFSGHEAFCREGYENAEALLVHVEHIDALLKEMLQYSAISRLEIHGPEEELAKLREPLSAIGPTYYALQLGMRR